MPEPSPLLRLARGVAFLIGAATLSALGLLLVDRLTPSIWASDHVYLEALVVVFLAYVLAKAIGSTIQAALQNAGRMRNFPIVRLFVNLVVSSLVVAALLNLFGVSLQNLFFGSAFAGIVLGLAGQTVLANVLAGLLLVSAAPFRAGERIALASGTYGVIASSYPHEQGFPTYSGTVIDVGLIYTDLRLDNGRPARIPNGAVLQALIVNLSSVGPRVQRIRVTLPLTTPVATVEAGLARYLSEHPPVPGLPPPHVEASDVSTSTWDATFVLSTTEPSEERVRDELLRAVLPVLQVPPGSGTGVAAPKDRASAGPR
ncbi:MAG TPA: mechanosensitive ion channel family protein [Thermoplasmata archaeon]|nr:mechanosensitive ion channel family protein [Thermoplasmata archaeon]